MDTSPSPGLSFFSHHTVTQHLIYPNLSNTDTISFARVVHSPGRQLAVHLSSRENSGGVNSPRCFEHTG
ncbi:hypothetical protein OPQ81_006303 [Rhizoctonia solani]|nr:hypothetical protein OPQ81_006303 [Rhizoctonia solani]